MKDLSDSFLYLLTPSDIIDPDILIPMVVEAVRAGADMIQFRNKGAVTRRLIETGMLLCEAVHREGAIFIVNDRIDVAIATGADGVHLGQEDLPIRSAKRVFGEGHIIGISTHSPEQACQAEREGAAYVGFGPVYPTPAKGDYRPIGTGSFRTLNRDLSIPYFAIGGICIENIADVIAKGASRVAVSNGVFGQEDAAGYARLIKSKLMKMT